MISLQLGCHIHHKPSIMMLAYQILQSAWHHLTLNTQEYLEINQYCCLDIFIGGRFDTCKIVCIRNLRT